MIKIMALLTLYDIKDKVTPKFFREIIKQAWLGDPDWIADLIYELDGEDDKTYPFGFHKKFKTYKSEDFDLKTIFDQLAWEVVNNFKPSEADLEEKRLIEEDDE